MISSILSACREPSENIITGSVSEAAVNTSPIETNLTEADVSSNTALLQGESFRLYYDTEKWNDSTYLNEQLESYDSTSSNDMILELKNAEGNFLIIKDNNVGRKGVFTTDTLGAQYEASVASDDRATFLDCKDIELNGHKGICVTIQPNDDSMMEMWYFWHGTYQTMFAIDTSKELFDKLHPDFMQVINSAELY